MDIAKLKEAGIDYDEGLKRFANREDLYEKYLGKFPDDPAMSQLEAFLAEKNYAEAFKCAHSFFFQKDDGTGSFFSVELLRPLFISNGFSFCHLRLNINQHLELLRGRNLGRTAF